MSIVDIFRFYLYSISASTLFSLICISDIKVDDSKVMKQITAELLTLFSRQG